MKRIISGFVLLLSSFAYAQTIPIETATYSDTVASTSSRAESPVDVSYSNIDALTSAVSDANAGREKKTLTSKKSYELCQKVNAFEESLKPKNPTSVSSNAYYAQALAEHINKLNHVKNSQTDMPLMYKYYGSNYRKKISDEVDVLNPELKLAKNRADSAYPSMSGYKALSDEQRKTLAAFSDLRSGCKAHTKKWGANVSSLSPLVKSIGWVQVMDEAMGVKQPSGAKPSSKSSSGSN